ncbi:MAG TPA: glycosyltransferase family 4 protein [Pyrinomonadaceae bacterium]|nr:glycosyltransferase family 4 protein [Pyrinomonadaceae bacterium]
MKIALVVHDLHEHGGHSLYTRVLADELSARHQVTVFANRCERPDDASWRFCQVSAWRQSALSTVQTFPLGLSALGSKLSDFDIRHVQGYCGGRPNVVTAHICVAAYLDSLREISARNRLSLRLMAAAERRFFRRYEGQVIAISKKIARELREFYGVRGAISVVPHGVDASRFGSLQRERYRTAVRTELGLNEEQTTVLYVGDLTKAHVHLKALAGSAPQVQFIIVSGSTRYRWSMPNVRFLPPTTELERYYAAADAFVFPTTYDAFGMVLLEAMASGLPVFSSDCAGAAELIRHGDDGFVFPLDDWMEASVAALRDREALRTIGRQAEKTAGAYDWSAVVREVEQVYCQTAANTGFLKSETPSGEYRYQR